MTIKILEKLKNWKPIHLCWWFKKHGWKIPKYLIGNPDYRSNADIDDEDMADITDWANGDSGTGVSSQVTFDGKSCMKLDSGATGGGGSEAIRSQDIGSFGDRTVFSMNLYHDKIGTKDGLDTFRFFANNGSNQLVLYFASDGLFIFSGGAWNEIGTDLVVQDTWQEWTFDVDWVAKTVDVYLNDVLKASDIACSYASVIANGTINFTQASDATTNLITYIDWFKAGSDFEPPPPPFIDQEGFQFRADDGNEIEATPLTNQDVGITRAKNLNTRLRFLINAVRNPSAKQFQIEHRKKGVGNWFKILGG